MQTYPRRFVLMSVIYLALGVLLGLDMAAVPAHAYLIRFVHLHALLLGFMAMMIFGVAYHILPRFNARPVRWPRLIGVHFWLMNLGLPVFLAGHLLRSLTQSPVAHALFLAGACSVAMSLFLFVFNMAGVVSAAGEAAPAPPSVPSAQSGGHSVPPHSGNSLPPIDGSLSMGALIEAYPQAKRVLEKHFGEGCLDCPGIAVESIAEGASMHGVELQVIMEDLREATRAVKAEGASLKVPEPDMTFNEIIARWPLSVAVFQKFGMDSCCGGSHPVQMMCEKKGIDLKALMLELKKLA